MKALRFVRADLGFGCHGRTVTIPGGDGPVVIAGPNGAGKSTLLEALVRVPFGYYRRQEREGRDLAERRPWSGGPYRARVELVDGDGRTHAFERDFATDRVKIEQDGRVAWEGDGNPAGTNVEALACRERLQQLFGIVTAHAYASLAWIRQGELVETELDEQLLRLASGGDHDVARAIASIDEAARAWTREPVAEGARAGRSPRRLEELHARAAVLREELDRARAAESMRAPLAAAVERLDGRATTVAADIARHESAAAALARRDGLARDRERMEERLAAGDRVLRRIEREADHLDRLDAGWSAIDASRRLPADFPERAARVEQMLDRLERLERRRTEAEAELARSRVPSWGWIACALAALGAVGSAAVASPRILYVLAAAAFATALASLVFHRRAARSARDRARGAVEALVAERSEVSDRIDIERGAVAGRVAPHELAAARADWLHQDGLARDRERAAAALGRSTADAAELLDGALFREATFREHRALAKRLGDHITALRNRLAEHARLVREAQDDPALAVGADATSVAERLTYLRSEREELAAGLRAAERRLIEEGRPSRSTLAIEEELEHVRDEAAELEERIEAHRAAHALLTDAHRSFREHDERRLAAAISARVAELATGSLGPVELEGERAGNPGVICGDRLLPLRCPPLSYGEYHAVLLGVRLGASDVLARNAAPLPLILDEPFAHLDEVHAAALWGQLVLVARERQVILATQETALLERLGVSPHVELHAASRVTRGL